MSKVRCRYAPSPTGYFHIGGARTALFNYLYAKHYGGDFVVRIEDTDQERHVETGVDSQLDGIDWLGFSPDESLKNPGNYGPYRQTQKLQRYKELANKLLDQGKAYYCFCTQEELEKSREQSLASHETPKYNRKCLNLSKQEIDNKLASGIKPVIRLKINHKEVFEWDDLIRGKISVPADALTDPVIMKSNGIPMYNFGVVVDDYDMDISHVLRGEEHISNTPYQIAIKNALGFDSKEIKYGHMSIIVDETGKKLSKRNASIKQFIEDYKNLGYVPEAITNFISLLGWSPKDNVEIKSIEELISAFDGTRMSNAPAFFDIKKMDSLSSIYFKNMDDKKYINYVNKFIDIDLPSFGNRSNELLLIYKPQIAYAKQLNDLIKDNFLSFGFEHFSDSVKEIINTDFFKKNINCLKDIINNIQSITLENGNDIVNKVKEITGLKGKELYMPIRIAAIGKEHGPEMNKILYIIGKEKILENINNFN